MPLPYYQYLALSCSQTDFCLWFEEITFVRLPFLLFLCCRCCVVFLLCTVAACEPKEALHNTLQHGTACASALASLLATMFATAREDGCAVKTSLVFGKNLLYRSTDSPSAALALKTGCQCCLRTAYSDSTMGAEPYLCIPSRSARCRILLRVVQV